MALRINEVVRRLSPFVDEGVEVLDLGAGTGKVARLLRERCGIRLTLADIVPNNRTDLPFVQIDDPYCVPLPDRSFDTVLLLFVLHHVPDTGGQRKLLEECRRLARRRVLIMEDTPATKLERLINTGWDWVLNFYLGVPTPFTFRTTGEWIEEFRSCGFETLRHERYRPIWPTLKTYHHTFFVLGNRD
ncbi:MAG: class I SAM-dependent methyltransferase [Actinomycetota bacterium]